MGRWLRRLGPFVALGLGLGLILFFAYREVAAPLGKFAPASGSQEVQGSTTVGQSFVAPFDGLYRIDVYVGPGTQPNNADMLFHLRAAPGATEDLRFGALSASPVKGEGWMDFQFPPIPDSGGRRYLLLIESPSSTADDALSVSLRSGPAGLRDGTYYLNGVASDGDLALQYYCQPGPVAWLAGLFGMMAQGKPSIAGEPALYGALFAVYAILLAVAAYILVHTSPQEGDL
jgi:hypothetical protein